MVFLKNTAKRVRDALANEAVRTFIMLRFFLEDSGLCESDCRFALNKYLHGIAGAKVAEIKEFCPTGIEAVRVQRSKQHVDADEIAVVEGVLESTKNDMMEKPETFLGREGWFMALARDLARVWPGPTRIDKKNAKKAKDAKHVERRDFDPSRLVQNFGFGEFEVALFLAVTAFIRVSYPKRTFSARTTALIQHSYWQMFKFDCRHNVFCTCSLNKHLIWFSNEQGGGKKITPCHYASIKALQETMGTMTRLMATYAPELVDLKSMYMDDLKLDRKTPLWPRLTEARWGSQSTDVIAALTYIKTERAKTAEADTVTDEETTAYKNKGFVPVVVCPKLPMTAADVHPQDGKKEAGSMGGEKEAVKT